MRYRFYNGDVLIGYSELEHDDRSMGIRVGRFHPDTGYAPLEPVCRASSMARFDEHMERQASGDPGKLESLCARIEQLQEQVDNLDLHMETEDGQAIGTSWISIEDFSLELGEHEREVTIQVDSHQTYVQFFA